MTEKEILKNLIKIHAKYSDEKYSDEFSQMCAMWSTYDPPDILECTEQLEEISEMINKNIEEDYAVELYDMSLKAAAAALYLFHKNNLS